MTQATFLKAWRALASYHQGGVPFRGWLYRIAHHTVIDYYRTSREPDCSLEDLEVADTSHVPEEDVMVQERTQERQEVLRKALIRLRPAYQQVLTLRFLNGLDYPETAEVMGRNVNTVRVLQFRALEALRTVVAKEGVG